MIIEILTFSISSQMTARLDNVEVGNIIATCQKHPTSILSKQSYQMINSVLPENGVDILVQEIVILFPSVKFFVKAFEFL